MSLRVKDKSEEKANSERQTGNAMNENTIYYLHISQHALNKHAFVSVHSPTMPCVVNISNNIIITAVLAVVVSFTTYLWR